MSFTFSHAINYFLHSSTYSFVDNVLRYACPYVSEALLKVAGVAEAVLYTWSCINPQIRWLTGFRRCILSDSDVNKTKFLRPRPK